MNTIGRMSVTLRVPRGKLRQLVGSVLGDFLSEVYPGKEDIDIQNLDNTKCMTDATMKIRRLKAKCRVLYHELAAIRERKCPCCSSGADYTLKRVSDGKQQN